MFEECGADKSAAEVVGGNFNARNEPETEQRERLH
jgi:hypothetical protein